MNQALLSSTHQWVSQQIDQRLRHYLAVLPAQQTNLAKAMEYVLLNGGKRMRPLLCVLIGDAVELDRHSLVTIGAAIECIHAYSLVHDDLPAMDDDELRRGKPSCHIQFDEATAILVGDALQSLAFDILTRNDEINADAQNVVKLVQQLAVASGYSGMVGGQAMDLAATGQTSQVKHTLDTLTTLHRLKTGALLKACVMMPITLASQVTERETAAFTVFAEAVGLAFQVQDDILDCTGSIEQIGKPIGSDNAQYKHTFPALLGIEGAKEHLHKLYQESLQALQTLPYNVESLNAFCELMIRRDH